MIGENVSLVSFQRIVLVLVQAYKSTNVYRMK